MDRNNPVLYRVFETLAVTRQLHTCSVEDRNGSNIKDLSIPAADSADIQGGSEKSKLLILAVNEINASQTRVSFAKFIPKLVEKMFDMCSIVPNYSFSILKFFIKILSFLLILPNNNDLKYNTQLDRYET